MQQLLAFLAALSLGFVCVVAQGQSAEMPSAPSAPVPSAPVPSAPVGAAKPLFALPAETYERPVGKAPVRAITPEEFCPSDPLKPRQEQPIPKEIQGEVRNYNQLVSTQVLYHWMHQKHLIVYKDRTLTLYFTIKPDGSYTTPIITSSSGKSEYDQFAIAAIIGRDSYPPLPRGMTEPLKLCYRFVYNLRPGGGFTPIYDNWQKPEPAAKP